MAAVASGARIKPASAARRSTARRSMRRRAPPLRQERCRWRDRPRGLPVMAAVASGARKRKMMRSALRWQPNPSCSERRSTGSRPAHVCASNCHPWCAAPDLQLSARVAVRSRRRCAPGAAKALMKRGTACSQQGAFAPSWRVSPLRGEARPCLSQLFAFVPPSMRGNATAAPRWHSAGRWQDKSREVRPGRTAAERGNVSALAQRALFAAACIFGERKKDQCSAHLALSRLGRVSNHGALQRSVACISAIRVSPRLVAHCGKVS
jgi:hypothetical protein